MAFPRFHFLSVTTDENVVTLRHAECVSWDMLGCILVSLMELFGVLFCLMEKLKKLEHGNIMREHFAPKGTPYTAITHVIAAHVFQIPRYV